MAKTQIRPYQAGQIYTIELPELFHVIRAQVSRESSTVTRSAGEFNGYMTYDEALDAAEFGKWSAPKIEALTIPQIVGESEEMRYTYDVIGQSLDIASYLTGEPECWLTEEPIRKPCGKVMRLSIEIGASACIPAQSLANRGQAVIALVNSLELAGHSVEVTIVRSWFNAKEENYKFLIPVKHAGQALDMKRLQFMLGHPAFLRRLMFGLSEVAQGATVHKCTTHPTPYRPEGFTAHVSHNDGIGDTLGESLEWAKSLAASLTDAAALTAAN
jgi:hypothetical protein